ncbi:porin [Myroides pelagicus]|uniref:Outer membrane beta-barrel protein n=1 Tax=Myroides pelagicus TaxID=270914 RepID=A0A7K1GHU3_9FLAO|nr:porin [Myroides pelagicus]MEC4114107.1 porin [Myroides pelagicus]MTH28466.1 outer membrane beta-barrel protein [Myroides pelagicus]
MKQTILWASLAFLSAMTAAVAQDKQSKWTDSINVHAYGELYYMYDFNQTNTGQLNDFLYSFNRHNEVNLNFAMVKLNYQQQRVRANLAFMAGSYVKSNLVNEPDGLKNIYEASVGVKLLSDKELWLDVGIMPSHIGFESNIGADVMTMSRSMMAENSPYFSSAAKLSYHTPNQQWMIALNVMNGWQRIERPTGNSTLAIGHQVTYTPTSQWTVNSSSFIGSDTPDQERKMRYFHNLYASYQVNDRVMLLAGIDTGLQQKAKASTSYSHWYAPLVMGQYKFDNKWSVTGRVEYYHDEDGVIIATDTPHGFQTLGYSVNIDYRITDQVMWRIEARTLSSKDAVFTRNQTAVTGQTFIGSSLSIKL